jgi:murein DD-endopeptidase MepM/ murein hydrolase activator NlpD
VKLQQPWPDPYQVNKRSPYGPRVHPITGKRTFHHGVDVALPNGTPLTAPADGVVVHKNRTASAGFNLILRHEGTWHTVYYHLQKPSHLALGATVKTGDNIALSGNTGASTGPHLHWELRKSRTWGDTVDPMPYLVSGETSQPALTVEETPEFVTEIASTPQQRPVRKPRPFPKRPAHLQPTLASIFNLRRNMK